MSVFLLSLSFTRWGSLLHIFLLKSNSAGEKPVVVCGVDYEWCHLSTARWHLQIIDLQFRCCHLNISEGHCLQNCLCAQEVNVVFHHLVVWAIIPIAHMHILKKIWRVVISFHVYDLEIIALKSWVPKFNVRWWSWFWISKNKLNCMVCSQWRVWTFCHTGTSAVFL